MSVCLQDPRGGVVSAHCLACLQGPRGGVVSAHCLACLQDPEGAGVWYGVVSAHCLTQQQSLPPFLHLLSLRALTFYRGHHPCHNFRNTAKLPAFCSRGCSLESVP